jgi:hypothetical protein
MMFASVNITFLKEQDSHICPLHLTVFATNNHYLSKVFSATLSLPYPKIRLYDSF